MTKKLALIVLLTTLGLAQSLLVVFGVFYVVEHLPVGNDLQGWLHGSAGIVALASLLWPVYVIKHLTL